LNTRINKNHVLALLVLIGSLGPLAADAYLPALSLLTTFFQVSDKMLKFSVTAYFVGFAGAQIIFGPLSDAYGRKKVILLGIAIGAFGAFVCFSALTIWQFYLGRFILGVGMASGIPVARAVLKDLFSGKSLSEAASTINMVFALMPFITPLIGAYLASYYQWQTLFQLVLLASILVFILTLLYLPETNKHLNPSILKPKNLSTAFINVIKDRQVFIYGFSTLCAFACATAYMVSAPFIFLNTLGLSMIEFAWFAGLVTLSYIVGGIVNNQLTKYLALDRIILLALIGMLLVAISISLCLMIWSVNLTLMIVNVFLLMLASRMVFPNALAGAFTSKQKEVGIISSVYGLYHTMGAILASAIIGLLSFDAATSMAWVLMGFSTLGLISFSLRVKRQTSLD